MMWYIKKFASAGPYSAHMCVIMSFDGKFANEFEWADLHVRRRYDIYVFMCFVGHRFDKFVALTAV